MTESVAMIIRSAVAIVAGALLLTGCAATRTLPTVPDPPPGVEVVCEKALLTGTLALSESDPRVAWIVAPTGARVDVAWPAGFSARLVPAGAIVTAEGMVVAVAGDQIRLGGGFHPQTGVFTICEINGHTYSARPAVVQVEATRRRLRR